MDRRTFLAALGAGSLAGCAGLGDGEKTRTPTREPASSGAFSVSQERLPVPGSELERGVRRDAIPAIVEPAFGSDWSGVEVEVRDEFGQRVATPRLAPGDRVIGIERGGEARAYPLRALNWHEVVNDRLSGPLLVTFCPLCGSAIVAVRTIDGRETIFGVSGLLWHSNLVLYDRETDSLWSQVAATAIRGPATGTTLQLLPSTLTTWETWREAHPDTQVLRPPPESNTVVGRENGTRNYTLNPYGGYETNSQIRLDTVTVETSPLHPKTQVLGIAAGDAARAYPFPLVEKEQVINDEVGGLPVVVALAPGGTMVGYDKRIEGRTLRFEPADEKHVRAGSSRWEVASGRAVDGPLEGSRLSQATDRPPMFWFSWLDFHPETTVYGR